MDSVLEDVLVELLVDLPADADVPIVASAPERTWIWSDLHLSDRSVLLGWDRPFRSVEEMNRHLLRNWRRRVDADDTVICLGDVAHPGCLARRPPLPRRSGDRGYAECSTWPNARASDSWSSAITTATFRHCVELVSTRPAGSRCAPPIAAARPRPLRLTQARIGDTLHDGNGIRVAIVNAFTTVNPETEATVRAVDLPSRRCGFRAVPRVPLPGRGLAEGQDAAFRMGAFPISRSRAHTHRRHGHPLQTVPSAGLIERPQEKNRVDALR